MSLGGPGVSIGGVRILKAWKQKNDGFGSEEFPFH